MEKNNKTLNVPHLRFPEFSDEWEVHKLSEYLDFKNGLNPEAKRIGHGLPFISVIDILVDDVIHYDNIRSKVDATNKEIECFGVKKGDLLFQRSSETFEDIGRANVYMDDRTAIYGGFVICGRKTGNYDPLFFKYLLATPLARKRTCRMGAGAQHFNIGQEGLSKISLHFPTVGEQKKIADLLELIDQRIMTQKKIIEKYESLIRGISNKLLYADNGIPVRLGDILLERSERTKVNNQHEVLSSTVKGIFSQREYFSKDIASENNVGYKIIRLHDVVLSPQNLWMGNINYNDKFDIGIVSPSSKIFSIAEGYDKRFTSALLKTHRALYNYMQVSEQGASVVRRNLNMEAFEQLVFKIPRYTTQCEIGRILDSMQKSLGIAISTQSHLEQQKQWLLRNLFI